MAVTASSAAQYSLDALDETRSELAREAAMLYSVAESQLNEDDLQEAERAAKEALVFFRELGNRQAVADTMRILVGVHRAREDVQQAEDAITNELERFRENDDAYGEGAMLLALAEVNADRRNDEAVQSG